MGYVPLCQNCNEPGHIAPHCTKPPIQRPKVNFVTTASTSGTKNDVSVQLADWEADTKLATVDTVSKIRFDPQVITIPSSPEGWPSDSAWDTFGVSMRSKGEAKSASNREEKKKKGKNPVKVPSESSSDSDSEPVKLDTYKDDISTLVREALKGQTSGKADATPSNELNEWSRVHKKIARGMRRRKKLLKEESIAAYAITEEDRGRKKPMRINWGPVPHESETLSHDSDDYSTDSNEDSAYDSDESSVNFLQCYEADTADLEAYHEEIRALYVSGLESEAEKPIQFQGAEIYNLQRPRTETVSNLTFDAHYPLSEGKKGGDLEEHDGKFADLLEEAKRAIPDTPLQEREDTDVAGATTFKMTEGMTEKKTGRHSRCQT
ncbi:hypothetical protein R1sor_018039 [Riccia sorocarpa]|uniref:CCHC-type domain-containing protein n=1 Tax=Riccia sorocarpa TaxID=122646 RepID=A0ABD3ICL6_9MARC